MSDTFQSTLGVKQGCPLSPTLFGIYIDDFQAELETAGGDLDLPTLCGVQAPALFYADDLDLVSTSVRGLQAQLELLESFCTRWRLTVNVKFVCLFVCLFFTEGVLTKAVFKNKALRHSAASHV